MVVCVPAHVPCRFAPESAPLVCCLQAGLQWTSELAGECKTCVLRLLLSGYFQPPIRSGALRVLIGWEHPDEPHSACMAEDCK